MSELLQLELLVSLLVSELLQLEAHSNTESTASPLKQSLLQAYPNSCLQRLRLLDGRDEGKQVESLLKVQLCGLGVVGAGEQLSGNSSD